jgi:hypothetical protein
VNTLADALESLAGILEGKRKRSKLLLVAAFLDFDRSGRAINPVDVSVGDDLYLRRPEDPGAGSIIPGPPANGGAADFLTNRGPTTPGRLYARALEKVKAGKTAEIKVSVYEKRWETDADPCDVCLENATAGWIDADETFPSGDEEPDAHPNCKCELVMRLAEP